MRKYLLLAVGTCFLIFYVARTDLRSLYEKAVGFPLLVAAAIVLLNGACGVVKTLRWTRFLARGGVTERFGHAFLAVHAGFFMGLVTPGTAGELTRAASLAAGRDEGLAILVFEKICDLAVLGGLVALTVAGFAGGPNALILTLLGLAGACGVGSWLWSRHRGFVLRPLRRVLLRVFSAEGVKGAEQVFERFNKLATNLRSVAASLLYSLALWLLSLVQVALIYRGLEVRPSWGFVALTYFLPYFVGVVTLVPLGLGTFELSLKQLATSATAHVPAEVGALVPAFFRLFVTLPLVLFGYGCQAALTLMQRRRRASP